MPSIKPIVYICAPYSGTPEEIQRNVENVKRYCRFAADQGYAPLSTHLAICGFLRDEIAQERELGIEIDKTLLSVCSELWVFGDRISTGMNIEITTFQLTGKPVRYFTETCEVRTITHSMQEAIGLANKLIDAWENDDVYKQAVAVLEILLREIDNMATANKPLTLAQETALSKSCAKYQNDTCEQKQNPAHHCAGCLSYKPGDVS